MTVGKVLKRSLKWDQTGIFSLICLKVTSKIRTIVKKIGLKKIATKLWRAITPKYPQQLYRSMPGKHKPSLMLGQPILVIEIRFWHLFVVFDPPIELIY